MIVDYYSRYFEVMIMRKTDAAHVIEAFEKIFKRLGYPRKMIADNGPPYNSKEISDYCRECGIALMYSLPFQPRINGEVEILNKALVKRLIISLNKKGDWKKELDDFLFTHRTTPHSTTNVPPLELFLKRPTRDKLPTITDLTVEWNPVLKDVRDVDANAK